MKFLPNYFKCSRITGVCRKLFSLFCDGLQWLVSWNITTTTIMRFLMLPHVNSDGSRQAWVYWREFWSLFGQLLTAITLKQLSTDLSCSIAGFLQLREYFEAKLLSWNQPFQTPSSWSWSFSEASDYSRGCVDAGSNPIALTAAHACEQHWERRSAVLLGPERFCAVHH